MTIKNNTLVAEIGLKAAAAWNVASKEGDGGDALATHALYIAARVASFDALVNRGSKSEPEIETVSFDLLTYDVDPFNADGSVDMKLKAARTAAVAQHVFGLDELDNAVKQRIGRASKMALYLARKYAHLDDEEYMLQVATRTVKVSRATGSNMTTCLVVPHEAIYSPPAEDADEEDKAYYERNRMAPKTLNGKDKASLAELGKRANPPKTTRAAGEAKDKGASLVASIDYVNAIVLQNANPDADESDIALSNELRRKLFDLSQSIAAYFAADPLDESDDIDFGQSKEIAA
jgi:hypothetical protein